MRLHKLFVPFLLVALAGGCGEPEKAEDKPEKPAKAKTKAPVAKAKTPKRKAAPKPKPKATPLAKSYEGTWERDDGVRYTVKDDGTTVTGELANDPKSRWKSVKLDLKRENDVLKGTASFVTAAGVRFRNPFYVSSGPTTMTVEQLVKADECGWGGASLKLTVDPLPYINRHPRYGYYPAKGFLAFTAERRLTLDELHQIAPGSAC